MHLSESIRTAISSLMANKMRSLLTMLGIIIGVASVITLVSLGNGFAGLIDNEISANKANLIYVSGTAPNGYPSLSIDDAQAIADSDNSENIVGASSITTIPGTISSDEANLFAAVSAISDNYFEMNAIAELSAGTLFSETDEALAVLGESLAADLFPDESAIGNTISISGESFEVVAVLVAVEDDDEPAAFLPPGASERDNPLNFVPDSDTMVFVPLAAAIDLLPLNTTENGDIAVSTIVVAATDETVIEFATEEISKILRSQHNLVNDADDDFSLINQGAIADTFAIISGTLTMFLGAIAGISLLVGGIGIMNIMLVSVTERTREIGIRKAMGALRRDILIQFILESMILSLVGGAIGFFLGILLSTAGGSAIGVSAGVNLTTVVMAVGFSTIVGLIFGVYPAWKAARLLPIDALRYE